MWDLSSPTRDRTRTPCLGRKSVNHWTAREVPWFFVSFFFFFNFKLSNNLMSGKKALTDLSTGGI